MAPWTMYSCGALSLLLLMVSVVLLLTHTFMDTVEGEVKKATVLKNGTEVFNDWVNPPPPIYMQFYFFNLTNPLEVLDGEKPVVDEIGPYTYRNGDIPVCRLLVLNRCGSWTGMELFLGKRADHYGGSWRKDRHRPHTL